MSKEFRECEACGKEFYKRVRDSSAEWESRRYCSISCRNKSTPPVPAHIRFWQYISKESSGCWLWTGSVDGGGYGTLSRGRNLSPHKAHRVSFEMRNGPIPKGMHICHKCDTPACVNPDHLFLGTPKDNLQDASRKNRLNEKSLLNLRPGCKGVRGAGPKNNQEISNESRS